MIVHGAYLQRSSMQYVNKEEIKSNASELGLDVQTDRLRPTD